MAGPGGESGPVTAEGDTAAPWIGTLLAAALVVLALVHSAPFHHDDAFITFRYAARWLSGHGLTWSGITPVEGFTNPLWLFQLVGLRALGLDFLQAAQALGYLYFAALTAFWIHTEGNRPLLLLCLTQPALLLWTASGLETTSFCLWLVIAVWAFQKTASHPTPTAAAWLGGSLSLATLTRPEAAGIIGTVTFFLAARAQRNQTSLRPLGLLLATTLLPLGAYLAFRLHTFGEWLPNAARAKMSGIPISWQLESAAQYFAETAPYVAAPSALALWVMRGRPLLQATAVLFVVPILLATVLVGGDHMPRARLLVPAVVVLLFAAGTPELRSPQASQAERAPIFRWPLTTSTRICLLLIAAQSVFVFSEEVTPDPAANFGSAAGKKLESVLPAGATVALATAGSTPFYAPSLEFIDTLGLNDAHIARVPLSKRQTKWQSVAGHRRGDGAYVLSRQPDAIILAHAAGELGEEPKAWFLSDLELIESQEFRKLYRPYELEVDKPVPIEFIPDYALEHYRRTGGPLPQMRLKLFLRRGTAGEAAVIRAGGRALTPFWE